MIRIGIVGDIGSGKSHIAKKFGYPVFNADKEVAKLYKKNKKCYKKLKKSLPYYIKSFPVKKARLSQAIVANYNNIKKINRIVHPEIRIKLNKFIKKNKNKKFVILDIPLLMENKIYKKNDILIFIDAQRGQINKRLKLNPKIVKKFRKIQLPLEVKRKRSNYIIKNNFKNNYVKKNVKNTIKKILLNA